MSIISQQGWTPYQVLGETVGWVWSCKCGNTILLAKEWDYCDLCHRSITFPNPDEGTENNV